ncbi:MAG TPA: NRDE family protein [Stellaceae bacterium]|nr:NRDE family protein [Stellaceae bacterium]
MCTLVVLRRPGHDWPLIIAANRDEMIGRPWRAPGRHWPDRPEVVAGLDELANGSWLGLNDHGVVAGILNRFGTLGPAPGQRSRGELVLEALDHADAKDAAAALRQVDPRAYRPFNLIVADNRDAFWLRHADPAGRQPVAAKPLGAGLAMIAAGDLDESETPRLRRYRPRFAAAPAPDPASGDWAAWEALLADGEAAPQDGPAGAMRFATERGFATVSSALIALPSAAQAGRRPVFRFRAWQPEPSPWREVPSS